MEKITTQNELTAAYGLSPEVQEKIADIIEILDSNYGPERDINCDGGYIVVQLFGNTGRGSG